MDLENLPILEQLAELPNRVYSYVALTAIAGPLAFRILGFKLLAQIVRPLALVVLLGGMYAKQQRIESRSHSV